ncbi:tyrosine-type recombinase/integrase [Mesorhizobium sp.]|uniref:tyrosine-type recombinase/integrase n=1 Tax=Mesorhizobium sp. TaxID=1871066 RepID=UPI00344684E8
MRSDYVPALRFALLTGCRRAEIVGLTWSRVNFFNNQVTVTGKRGKSRTIPLTEEARELLWRLRGHQAEAVFTYVAVRTREGRERGNRADARPATSLSTAPAVEPRSARDGRGRSMLTESHRQTAS